MIIISMYYLTFCDVLITTKISDNPNTIALMLRSIQCEKLIADQVQCVQVETAMSAAPKPPSGHFNLLYFASASTFTGKQYEVLPAPLPLRKLFATLEERYTGIKPKVLESSLVTINLNYVDVPEDSNEGGADEPVIQEGDEVAIIPPVSSG